MDFEWDEAKRLANILKHGIDFDDAVRIFAGWVIHSEDQRRDYGERRYLAFGELDGRVIQIVYTLRNGRHRLISARRARRNERRAYHASVPEGRDEDEG